MEHEIDLLRIALSPYFVDAAIRRADNTIVVTVSHDETKVVRVLTQADLQDRHTLATLVDDFKRDMILAQDGVGHERVKLMQRLGSRGLSPFNSNNSKPNKLK